MHQVNARRHWNGLTPVSVMAVSLALIFGVLWFLGNPGRHLRARVRNPGLLPKNCGNLPQSSRGESSRSGTRTTLMEGPSPVMTTALSASRSAPCGRERSTRTWLSPRRRPAGAAGLGLSKGKSTSSMLTTAPMSTAAIPLAYALGPPCLSKRKKTSMSSARDVLLKPGRVSQRLKSRRKRLRIGCGLSFRLSPRRLLR